MKVAWSRQALRDRREQINFVARQNKRAALEIGETISHAVTRLARYPNLGRMGRKTGTRELPIARTPYLLVYRLRADSVQIVRLLHGAQQWEPD